MKKRNILLVDIGNTSISVGIGNDKSVSLLLRVSTARCSQIAVRKAILKITGKAAVAGSVLCSVVPSLNKLWIREMERAAGRKPLVVSHRLKLGIDVDYPRPESIGQDRLANVCGAVSLWGAPVLVADFGTASTFDVVNKEGTFIGGVIAPGLKLMADCMADGTALLPGIKIKAACPAIGRTTEQAMQIGAVKGYHGLVREIIQHLIRKNRLGRIKLVATGGLAALVLKGLDMPFKIDQSLTLRGLYCILKLNAEGI